MYHVRREFCMAVVVLFFQFCAKRQKIIIIPFYLLSLSGIGWGRLFAVSFWFTSFFFDSKHAAYVAHYYCCPNDPSIFTQIMLRLCWDGGTSSSNFLPLTLIRPSWHCTNVDNIWFSICCCRSRSTVVVVVFSCYRLNPTSPYINFRY